MTTDHSMDFETQVQTNPLSPNLNEQLAMADTATFKKDHVDIQVQYQTSPDNYVEGGVKISRQANFPTAFSPMIKQSATKI